MHHDITPRLTAGLLLIALAVSAMLLHPMEVRYGHDIFYHLLRIESLFDQLRLGVGSFPINYTFFNGAGYASSACYPDAFLYIAAALRLAGLNPGQACTAFVVLCMAASCATAYWAARQLTSTRWTSAIAAIMYTLCQYKLDCVYTRGALGEIQAFIFIPLAMYAVYDMLFRNFRRPGVMVLSFTGLMLTHTISLFMAVTISAVLCLIFWRRALQHLLTLPVLAGLTLGITAFFWIPCVEMLLTMPLKAAQPWTSAAENAVSPLLLFANVKLGGAQAGMGMALFLLCLPGLALFRRDPANLPPAALDGWYALRCTAITSLAAGLCCALAATTLFPWQYAGFLGIIQFPWRLYSFASWFLSLGAAAALGCLLPLSVFTCGSTGQNRLRLLLTTLLCMSVSACLHYPMLPLRYYMLEQTYFTTPEERVYVGMAEWLPQTVDREVLLHDKHFCKDDLGRELACQTSPDRLLMSIALDSTARHWVDAPFIWYRGYAATFAPAAGGTPIPLTVDGTGRNGFCRLLVEGCSTGTIRLWYAGTNGQHAARWITLFSFLTGLALLIWRRHRARHNVSHKLF